MSDPWAAPPPPPPPEWSIAFAPTEPPRSRLKWLLTGLGVAILIVGGVIALRAVLVKALPDRAVKAEDGAFYIVPPPGWNKAPGKTQIAGVSFDLFVAGPQVNGFSVNVNVNDGAGAFVSMSKFSSQFAQYEQVLSNQYGANSFTGLSATMVDGESAYSFDYRLTAFNKTLGGEQVVVDHNHKTWFITLTSIEDQFQQESMTDFSQILASWRWQ